MGGRRALLTTGSPCSDRARVFADDADVQRHPGSDTIPAGACQRIGAAGTSAEPGGWRMAGRRVASPGRRVHPWYPWAVMLYDPAYRPAHGLDRSSAEVSPARYV